jgi:hypothetical protein
MVTFHDPRANPGAPVEPYELAIDASAKPITVGLVANGFPDSEAFLDQIEKAMAITMPNASFRRWNKRNASSIISDEMLDDVVESTDAVVAAYGH